MPSEIDNPSHTAPPDDPTEPLPARGDPAPAPLGLWHWMAAGLRAGACQRVHIGSATPTPMQLLLLMALAAAIQTGAARLAVAGPALFQFSVWLYPFSGTCLLLFLLWAIFLADRSPQLHPTPVLAWLALSTFALLPIGLFNETLAALAAHELLPLWWTGGAWLAWVLYALLWAWLVVVIWRVASALTPSRTTRARVIVAVLLLEVFATWQFSAPSWREDYAVQEHEKPESLTLSQAVFEDQRALLTQTLANVAPRQPDRINVFGLVYAPYAQSVFVRESAMVAGVLQDRFAAKGRVVQLVNHASVTDTIPWATNTNLQHSIQAIADKMARDTDVLVIYLTSHGGSDFKLASSHWPLEVEELTPQLLRSMLDEAGVRNRVIAVSACYAGGWIEPLAADATLVMTAADATHTSYGCGSKSELTYFGRAVFDEQLRQTHSFEQAFAAAVPVIQQREIDGNKTDGFSNPQLSVGKAIRPVLAGLEGALRQQAPQADAR